jgi:hypothetical protein
MEATASSPGTADASDAADRVGTISEPSTALEVEAMVPPRAPTATMGVLTGPSSPIPRSDQDVGAT